MAAPATNDRRIGAEPEHRYTPPPREEQPPKALPVWALKMKWDYEARITQLERKLADMEEAAMQTARSQRELATVERRVSLYGTQQVLEEMTLQVALSPKFKDLSPAEQRYVAMVGLVTGLTPEFYLHAWHNKRRVKTSSGTWETKDVLTVYPDYKALIARSRPLMEKVRRLTADEMRARGIPDRDVEEGSVAYIVEGYELDLAIQARQAGIEYEPKRGFGWWQAKKDDLQWDDRARKYVPTGKRIPNDIPNARDGDWVAEKCARRDLYNKFADLTIKLPPIAGARLENEDEYVFEGGEVVIDGTYTETPPADWLTPAAIARAEAYRDERGVTDEQIDAWLEVQDWRRSPVTAEEFKVVVDQLAMQAEVDGGSPSSAGEPELPEPDSPPATMEPKRCIRCKERDAAETPLGDDYCIPCATKVANEQAAKES